MIKLGISEHVEFEPNNDLRLAFGSDYAQEADFFADRQLQGQSSLVNVIRSFLSLDDFATSQERESEIVDRVDGSSRFGLGHDRDHPHTLA